MTINEAATSPLHDEFAPPEARDAVAAGYDEFVAPGEAALARTALLLVGLKPGERFLDVAAGSGGLSLPAARLGATVLATDWSPAMIERFESRVREERLPQAEGRVMDAHALDLEDDLFDVTGSQFGVMLVPDQPQALREMVRVTRPGGRVLLIAYGSPSEFEALQFFVAALHSVVEGFEGLPDDPPPLEFQVSDPEVMRSRLADSGLTEVEIDVTHREEVEFRSGVDYWNWMMSSNPIVSMVLADVTDEQQKNLREVLAGMIRERREVGSSAVLTAPLVIGWGRK